MTFKALLLVSLVLVGGTVGRPITAQPKVPLFSLEACFLDVPQPNRPARLWLQITNRSKQFRTLCRSWLDYAVLSDNPNETAEVKVESSLHGCGNNPVWLLLPGESRFDAYEVGALPASGTIQVSVRLEHYVAGSNSRPGEETTLSWKGRVADAVAAGVKVRSR